MFRYPCNLETNNELSYGDFFAKTGFEEYDNFAEIMKDLNVKAIICGKDEGVTFCANTKRYVSEYGCEYSLEDEGAVIYVLR